MVILSANINSLTFASTSLPSFRTFLIFAIPCFHTKLSLSANDMHLERNKAVVNAYFDRYWAKGDSSVVDELCTDDFLISYPNHGSHHGKKAAKAMIDDFREVSVPIPYLFSLSSNRHTGLSRLDIPPFRPTANCRGRLRRSPLDWRRYAHRSGFGRIRLEHG